MPRYTARWLQIPLEQHDGLSEQAQRRVDVRVAELLEEPEGPSQAYDPPSDQCTATVGGGAGLIVYAVVHQHRRVLILRLVRPPIRLPG